MRQLLAAAGVLLLIPAVASRLEAQQLEYSATLSASRGSFIFAEPTTSFVFGQELALVADRWRVGVSVPILSQNSSVITYLGGLPMPTGGPDAGAVRARASGTQIGMRRRSSGGGGGAMIVDGAAATTSAATALADSGFVALPGPFTTRLGDPVAQVGIDLVHAAGGRTRLGATFLAKLPVADVASGVGSGELDYGAGLSFSATPGRTFAFADVSHWVLGDLPDLPLRDLTTVALALGSTVDPRGRISALVTANVATAIVDNMEASRSVGVSFGFAVQEQRFLTVGAALGLSEATPDWTVTLGWRARLHER